MTTEKQRKLIEEIWSNNFDLIENGYGIGHSTFIDVMLDFHSQMMKEQSGTSQAIAFAKWLYDLDGDLRNKYITNKITHEELFTKFQQSTTPTDKINNNYL